VYQSKALKKQNHCTVGDMRLILLLRLILELVV
jgi:hypothetical protein